MKRETDRQKYDRVYNEGGEGYNPYAYEPEPPPNAEMAAIIAANRRADAYDRAVDKSYRLSREMHNCREDSDGYKVLAVQLAEVEAIIAGGRD